MSRCIMNESKECTHCGQCDVCDLDPNKICDNCCKCIESVQEDEDYAVVPVHLTRPNEDDEVEVTTADGWGEESSLVGEEDDEELPEPEFSDADPEEDDYVMEPLDIDPKLMLEWEEKLKQSFAETAGERDMLPNLHAQRIKKRKD